MFEHDRSSDHSKQGITGTPSKPPDLLHFFSFFPAALDRIVRPARVLGPMLPITRRDLRMSKTKLTRYSFRYSGLFRLAGLCKPLEMIVNRAGLELQPADCDASS